MSNTTQIYTEILNNIDELRANHEAAAKGNKAAARRARKAVGNIKKLATPYKQASVAENQ